MPSKTPEENRAQAKAWNEANPERYRARMKAWHAAHKDEANARRRARYAAHREQELTGIRERFAANRERYGAAKRSRYRVLTPDQRRERYLRQLYGLSMEEYRAMAERQGGACAICLRTPEKALVVDHDHSTDEVRALLCGQCNLAIGLFGESGEITRRAAEYLHRFQQRKASA